MLMNGRNQQHCKAIIFQLKSKKKKIFLIKALIRIATCTDLGYSLAKKKKKRKKVEAAKETMTGS